MENLTDIWSEICDKVICFVPDPLNDVKLWKKHVVKTKGSMKTLPFRFELHQFIRCMKTKPFPPSETPQSGLRFWPTDPQRLFRLPKEHLEDLCIKLQDENSSLRQHARTQEQKLRR